MKRGIILFTATVLAGLCFTACGSGSSSNEEITVDKVIGMKTYDTSADDGYTLIEFTYDVQGRLTYVTTTEHEGDGTLLDTRELTASYEKDVINVDNTYAIQHFSVEKGLITEEHSEIDEEDWGGFGSTYAFEDGRLSMVESIGEISGSTVYTWEDGNIVKVLGESEGATEESIFEPSDIADNCSVDIIDMTSFPCIGATSLPGFTAFRSANFPQRMTVISSCYDYDTEEDVVEGSYVKTFKYEVDEAGRVIKMVIKLISEGDTYTRTAEIVYED